MAEKAFYRVRDHFSVKLRDGGKVHEGGAVLHLTPVQFADHAHKLEDVSEDEARAADLADEADAEPAE